MAQLPSAFNANNHEQMNDFSVIEAGKYVAQVVKSEMCKCSETAKDPKGQYLKLHWKIIDKKAKGKMLWTQLNIINKNPTAVEIAQKELATICKSIGKVTINDSQELHGIPVLLTVGIEPAKANWPEKNVISFYESVSGVESAPINGGASAQPETASEQPPAEDKPKKKKPWE